MRLLTKYCKTIILKKHCCQTSLLTQSPQAGESGYNQTVRVDWIWGCCRVNCGSSSLKIHMYPSCSRCSYYCLQCHTSFSRDLWFLEFLFEAEQPFVSFPAPWRGLSPPDPPVADLIIAKSAQLKEAWPRSILKGLGPELICPTEC